MSIETIVRMAISESFELGQEYWRLVDSESASQWRKAAVTKEKFHELVQKTLVEIQYYEE